MRTVLGAIRKPALSSEKYLAPPDDAFFDISIIIINTCKLYLQMSNYFNGLYKYIYLFLLNFLLALFIVCIDNR